MEIEQIELVIGTDGKIRLETSGFNGDVCLKATEDLESLLGSNVVSREMTADFFSTHTGKTSEKVRISH